MLKLLLLFLLHVSQPKHFLVETESKAKTPGGSLTELGGLDASSSIDGRSGGFSGGTRPSKRIGVSSSVSSPVHLGYQMTITCAASHALGSCKFYPPRQPRTRMFRPPNIHTTFRPPRRTFIYKIEDLPDIWLPQDRIRVSDRASMDPKICEIVVDNIQSYDIGEWRCEVSCSKEESKKDRRCRRGGEKNIVVTETAGPYHLRAPATVSQDTGEFYYYNSSLVELGKPITISCNANKELASCMFEPPNSPWNNTYVRSALAAHCYVGIDQLPCYRSTSYLGNGTVYIKENSRISTSETAARGPCEIVVDNVEKKDLGDWRCLVRTNSEEITHMINVAEYKEEEYKEEEYKDDDNEHNDYNIVH